MEVVAREDKITHAIIGGGEQINFGITDDAMFMHMLSSTLYSDKILAVARETLCNAWDAHIEAGVTDRAVEITIDRDKLVIKDYGFGIPRSKIGAVYGTYGKSTKKHDGNQTGGFGLGCKSPFSYTDHFEVTSCNDGIKTIYKMTKSSAELEGKPGIVPILSVPTEETGITVTIDMLSLGDMHRFTSLLRRLTANGEIFACLNGEVIPVIPFSTAKNGYAITKQQVLENHSALCVRYGNVIYPLERHNAYASQYDEANAILDKLAGQYKNHGHEHQYSLILHAPGNTVSITPSREALSMETKTIETVIEVLNKFLAGHRAKFAVECLQLVRKKVTTMIEEKKFDSLMRRPSLYNIMSSTEYYGRKRHIITDTAEAANVLLAQEYPTTCNFEQKDIQHRLTQLIKADQTTLDKGLLRRFRREYLRTSTANGRKLSQPRSWFVKNILAPLVTSIKATPNMAVPRLMILGNHEMLKGWGATIEAYPLDGFRATDMMGYLPFVRKLVVMTHSKANIGDRISQYRDAEGNTFIELYGNRAGVMAYVVPRTPKLLEAARSFFASSEWTLIDLTAKVEYRERELREKATVVKKPKGYVSLNGCWDKGWKRFDQDLLTRTDAESRIEKPEFVTLLNSRSSKNGSRRDLPGYNSKVTDIIRRLYGHRGCAVLSTPQVEKLGSKGVPLIGDFLLAEISKLLKDKVIKTYVSMTPSKVKAVVDTGPNVDDAIDMIWSNEVLFQSFKLCAEVTQDQRDLLEVWDYLKRDRRWIASVDAVKAEESSIPLNKKALALGKKIQASKILPYLDLEAIQAGIVGEDPEYAINLFIKACKG